MGAIKAKKTFLLWTDLASGARFENFPLLSSIGRIPGCRVYTCIGHRYIYRATFEIVESPYLETSSFLSKTRGRCGF